MVWFSQEEETAEAETEKFNASMEKQNALFDRNNEVIRQNGKHRLEMAKAQGKSTKEIQKIELENFDQEEKIRRETLKKNKEQLAEKKRLYYLSLKEGNEENAKKLREEIIQDKRAIQDLKLGRQKYYQDRKVMLLNNENELKKEREEAKQRELEQQKEIAEKAKANAEAYRQRKQAEAQLAKEIAQNITDLTQENEQAQLANKEASLQAGFDYRKKIAELTIKDENELKEHLIQLEDERANEMLAIAKNQRDLDVKAINENAKREIAELKGSKEKIAEQTLLINKNTAQQIEALDIELAKKQQDLELQKLENQKQIEEAKLVASKEADAQRLVDIEAQIQAELNANRSGAEKQIELANERNRQIQADETKTEEEKRLFALKTEAEITAIRKAEAEKQAEIDKLATEKRKENLNSIIDASKQLVSDMFALQQMQIQKDLEDTTNANNEKQNALQKQFDEGIISAQEYEAKKLALENQARNEERAIKKKQFEANKRASIIEATIATAIAVARALPNPVTSILAGILGGAQIALIASQPTPAFADGGKVLSGKKIGAFDGRSISRSNGDNLLATVKTGEVILNKRQQAMLGGDNTFRRIGVPGFADGGLTGQSVASGVDSQLNMETMILNAVQNLPNPVVAVTDINTGQGRYATVIESATI